MEREKKLSHRAKALLERLGTEKRLCAAADKSEEGVRSGGLAFWTEPDGKRVGPATAREVIAAGLVHPEEDGLLAGQSQTYRAGAA